MAKLAEVAGYFLKLGLFGFGGPLALIAAMQRDLVENRGWLSREEFNRALALIKAMPGSIAPQIAVHIAASRAGKLAGLLAGICLILPAFLMMIAIAAFYTEVESLSWSAPVLFGMQAAALGVILSSVWDIAAPYRKQWVFSLVVVAAVVLTILKPSAEPLIILGSGIAGAVLSYLRQQKASNKPALHALLAPVSLATMSLPVGTLTAAGSVAPSALSSLVGIGLKSGAFVFGSGLAIVPLLMHDVVDVHGWLSKSEFLDALAFGQVTPGPVVVTITFIGYKVAGLLGATLATAAIFAPAFFNILTWFPLAERRLSRSPHTPAFVMWAIGAVAGSILVTVARLALEPGAAAPMWLGATLTAVALFVAQRTRIPAWGVIPLGGVAGALLLLVR